MPTEDSLVPRPATPAGFDPSRAAERAAEPDGWRLGEAAQRGLWEAIRGRRDVRRFRSDPVGDEALRRLLEAAHAAPSVGYLQPWRFVIARSPQRRAQVHELADRERLRQAQRFGRRVSHFMDQKIEGIREAPLGVLVCCEHPPPGEEILGRGTIPQTDAYSTACAVQNLWLAARAEGLGVGWVSFYEPVDMQAVFGLPAHVEPLAYLCVGYPDERPVRPGLESAGWANRTPLDDLIHEDTWSNERENGDSPRFLTVDPRENGDCPQFLTLAAAVAPADHAAAVAVRDRADRLVRPAGSLGALDRELERWAAATGSAPPERIRAGILVCCADHAVVRHGTSLWSPEITGQLAAAAAAKQTAIGVLAEHGSNRLIVADMGLSGPTPNGVRARKIGPAADITEQAALDPGQFAAALHAGHELATELIDDGVDCLVLGELGIGNTTAAAALSAALLDLTPQQAVGRGAGLDAAGLERKRATVAAALALHTGAADSIELLRRLGGAEAAAIAGAMLAAGARRTPVLLDGITIGAVALAVTKACPALRDYLIAGHRSAEPAHAAVLAALGLEPLLDLRLRLGEGSGAALALGLLEQMGALHRRMGTFAEAAVGAS